MTVLEKTFQIGTLSKDPKDRPPIVWIIPHCEHGRGSLRIPCMAKNYWLVKSEPDSYSWETFVKDGRTAWTGVRNFQSRNNLRAMKKGDFVAFYHSVTGKQVVGIAKVDKEAYPDPTAKEGDWSCVELVPAKALKKPIGLDIIKADKILTTMPLLRNSRLSVTPMNAEHFERLLQLAGTTV